MFYSFINPIFLLLTLNGGLLSLLLSITQYYFTKTDNDPLIIARIDLFIKKFYAFKKNRNFPFLSFEFFTQFSVNHQFY